MDTLHLAPQANSEQNFRRSTCQFLCLVSMIVELYAILLKIKQYSETELEFDVDKNYWTCPIIYPRR